MESCSYCLLEIKSRTEMWKYWCLYFFSSRIKYNDGNCPNYCQHHPQNFWIEGLAVFLFVYAFPKSEKWVSSPPWMSSEWNPMWIVFGATLSGFPSFRNSDGKKEDALWILWEENRRSIFFYFHLYMILWTIDFSWTQIFSITVHLLICSRRLY